MGQGQLISVRQIFSLRIGSRILGYKDWPIPLGNLKNTSYFYMLNIQRD